MEKTINKRSLGNKLRLLKDSIVRYNDAVVNKIYEVGGVSPLIFLKKFQNTPNLLGKLKVMYNLYDALCEMFHMKLEIKDIYSLYLFNVSNTINAINEKNINFNFLNEKLTNTKYFENYIEFLKECSEDKTLLDFLQNKF